LFILCFEKQFPDGFESGSASAGRSRKRRLARELLDHLTFMTTTNSSSTGSSEREKRYWNVGIVALTLGGALLILSKTAADPDLWGHVLFGLDLLRTGSLPTYDPYSYLSVGHPWINHELLSELAFGLAYKLGATPGLMLLKLAVVFSIGLLAHRHLRREGLDPLRAGIVLILVVFTMIPALGTIRPQLFTHLFFLLTLLVLVRAEQGNTASLWLLPLIFAIWINFHGGVLAGLGVLGLWAGAWIALPFIASRWKGRGPAPVLLITVLTASTLALLLNPYLWELPHFLFRTATVPRPDISEWRPLSLTTIPGLLYLVLIGSGAFVLLRTRRERRPPTLLVLLVTALLPLTAIRHLSLFALTFAVFLAGHIADVWSQRASQSRSGPPGGSRPARLAIVGLNFFAALVMVAASISRVACIPINEHSAIGLPARAVGLLLKAGTEGNLAIFFDYGEYAIWHLNDRIKVSMDGRRETVYPDSIYREALLFQAGVGPWDDVLEKRWDDVLEKRPTDMALVPRALPTFNLMKLKPGWKLAHQDSLVGLFVRGGWVPGERLTATEPPAVSYNGRGMCFP
jgi:hypothetical protein